MEKEQKSRALPGEVGFSLARIQDAMNEVAKASEQQLRDLTRLRIERNMAARHARCATIRTKQI